MKKNFIYTIITGLALAAVSCNDYLDTMPDNRTELDTKQKITQLLTSAYPASSYALINELMSDNSMDNGKNYDAPDRIVGEAYLWQDITDLEQDSPTHIWEQCYNAIAAANNALEYIKEAETTEDLRAQKAEALACRAYAHFVLVNVFCKHYNAATCATDLGIPYVEELETVVSKHYQRGTVKEVYEKIERDLLAAIPDLDDATYTIPKYHFNQKAAYAFAVRYYLYKAKFDKVIEYANLVLGSNPAPVLRDYQTYKSYVSWDEIGNAYISAEASCNLLIIPCKTIWTRIYGPYKYSHRYGHSRIVCQNETYWSEGIWEYTKDYAYASLWGTPPTKSCYPKLVEYFEYTDLVNKTGFINMVPVIFSTDEILLCRAEAYVMTGDYDAAVRDLEYWNISHGTPGSLNTQAVANYYGNAPFGYIKKEIHPAFQVTEGIQENLIHAILHVRRIETMHEGLRWFDIKRYGIEVTHNRAGIQPDILKKDDPRRVVQLPPDVIAAGMQANPR